VSIPFQNGPTSALLRRIFQTRPPTPRAPLLGCNPPLAPTNARNGGFVGLFNVFGRGYRGAAGFFLLLEASQRVTPLSKGLVTDTRT